MSHFQQEQIDYEEIIWQREAYEAEQEAQEAELKAELVCIVLKEEGDV